MKVRRNWDELSSSDKTKFLNALQALKSKPRGGDVSSWNYDQFSEAHNTHSGANHFHPQFLVWHREMLFQLEGALQRVANDNSIMIPYWDWRLDSQNPYRATVFGSAAFGGDGKGNCVTDGIAKDWKFNGDNCLVRCFASNPVWLAPESTNMLLSNSPNFESLRNNIEVAPHGTIHFTLGDCGGSINTMRSPDDPLFYLHHAMVDKLFATWQNSCEDFKDVNRYTASGFGPGTTLPPFGVTVSNVIDMAGGRYCYRYSDSRGDQPQVQMRTCTVKNNTTDPTNIAPEVNEKWMQIWFQKLIPGVERMIVATANLPKAKRDFKTELIHNVLDGLFQQINDDDDDDTPEGYGEDIEYSSTATADGEITITGTARATATAYPGDLNTIKKLPKYKGFRPEYNVTAPPATDKADKINVRYSTTANTRALEAMHFDKKKLDAILQFDKIVTDYFNNLKGYVSPAALIFNEERWKSRDNKKYY